VLVVAELKSTTLKSVMLRRTVMDHTIIRGVSQTPWNQVGIQRWYTNDDTNDDRGLDKEELASHC
jgi:hypothetical protein